MPSFCLPAVRLACKATSVLALTLLFATTTLAQPPAGGGKLDAVLEARAGRLVGRSRVIVEFRDTPDVRAITAHRGRAGRRLAAHRAQVAELDNVALAALAADPRVARVTIDRPAFAAMFRTGSATGATMARQQFDVCGRGVGVAIIDSGITSWHDDLNLVDGTRRTADSVVHFKDFTNDANDGRANLPSDGYGHGTHVAGSIAGSGYDSDGARAGIAPCASLIALKVLDANGNGYISDVIAALDYAVANKDAFNIGVINLSVASGVFESYKKDPLTLAARRAVDAGIVVIASAGNLGVNQNGDVQYGGVTSPGNAPWVLTVGAASHQGTARRSDDTVGDFSS
jgi:serine protease AprX